MNYASAFLWVSSGIFCGFLLDATPGSPYWILLFGWIVACAYLAGRNDQAMKP